MVAGPASPLGPNLDCAESTYCEATHIEIGRLCAERASDVEQSFEKRSGIG
jgi:hypothetical protein